MKRRNFLKSQHVKQYQSPRFRNPYRVQARSKKRLFMIASVITIIIILITAPILILRADHWQIEEISIDGLVSIEKAEVRAIVDEQLSQKRWWLFSQQNQIFFNKNQLSQTLQDKYYFETLDISISQQVLDINAQEKITSLIWISGEQYYFINLDGQIARALSETELNEARGRLGFQIIETDYEAGGQLQPNMPMIQDLSKTNVDEYKQVFTPEQTLALIGFDTEMRDLALEPTWYEIENPDSPWVTLRTSGGLLIMFELSGDYREQLAILKTVLDQYQDQIEDKSYIDIRFGNHVFVK